MKLGYKLEEDPGLTKNIHPLFQRTNERRPLGQEYIWPQFKSEAEYDTMLAVMKTTLQLASNMLETPKSLDFLHQVAHSSRKVSGKGLNSKGRPCREFGWTEPVPENNSFTRSSTRGTLRRLAYSLTFQIGDPEANPAVRQAFAVTQPNYANLPNGVKINEASGIQGIACNITLNDTYIVELRRLEAQEGDTSPQRMNLQLKMAITLCHEIAVSTTRNFRDFLVAEPEVQRELLAAHPFYFFNVSMLT